MKIKELKLVSIRGEHKGGSTRPLIIDAEDDTGEIATYVLKIYNKRSIHQNFAVAKEVLIAELAKDFDLPVPEYGVINFDHKYLNPFFEKDYIEGLDLGYKFCSKLQEGVVIFNPTIKNKFLEDYDLENVFAFDHLIMNVDRGGYHNKPNLLVTDDAFVLIDHELTLPFYSHPQQSTTNYWNAFMAFDCSKHIFYKPLKRKKKKDFIFDEFQMRLNNFKLTIFDVLFEDFNKFDIQYSTKEDCVHYFEWAKVNNAKIVQHLKNRIA